MRPLTICLLVSSLTCSALASIHPGSSQARQRERDPSAERRGRRCPDKKAMSSFGGGWLGTRPPAKTFQRTARGTQCFTHLSIVELDKMEESADPELKEHIYPPPKKTRFQLVMIEEVVKQSANIGSTAMQVVSETTAVATAASVTLTIPLKVAAEVAAKVATQLLSATSSDSGGAYGTGNRHHPATSSSSSSSSKLDLLSGSSQALGSLKKAISWL